MGPPHPTDDYCLSRCQAKKHPRAKVTSNSVWGLGQMAPPQQCTHMGWQHRTLKDLKLLQPGIKETPQLQNQQVRELYMHL